MPLVEMGDVEVDFPDEMDEEEIGAVLNRDFTAANAMMKMASRGDYSAMGESFSLEDMGLTELELAALVTSAVPILGTVTDVAALTDREVSGDDVAWWEWALSSVGAGAEAGAILGAVTPLVKKVREMPEVADKLQFLHNTNAAKLDRVDRMGGMPNPSLAATKTDVPFDDFGDITLVGKPDEFNPSRSLNDLFSADAYTVRAPSPVRMAKKGAWELLQKDVAPLKEQGVYTDEVVDAISKLETKKNISDYEYRKVDEFLNRHGLDPDKYLTPDEFFITNPDRDYYTQSAKLNPYTADEVSKWMRRFGGKNQEGGIASSGFGAMRASTTERIGSFKRARELAGNLQPKAAIDEIREAQEQAFFALAEDLKGSYEYQADAFGYIDEVSDFIRMSERMGVDRAAREVGFKDIPEYAMEDLKAYKEMLRKAPTEYFESKPRRVVSLDEFGGAIVPEGTEQQVLDVLKKHGIDRIETYDSPETRAAARSAFSDLMFSLGIPATMAAGIVAKQQTGEDMAQSYAPES